MFFDLIGLLVGIGLIFSTGFDKLRDHFWKAVGVLLVMVSTYQLTEMLVNV